MKEKFREQNFKAMGRQLIESCEEVTADYMRQGLKLTLRQLYYQLVTKNIIKNEERSYKNLSSLVSDARLAGMIDWNAIEDRIRVPRIPSEWENLRHIIDSVIYGYRLPRWKDQPAYAELWVEKDALAGVLQPLGRKYHVPIMVNRGYSSQSAMYDSSKRFLERAGRDLYLFYLGDLDPSGEDMVRDIRDRLELFGIPVVVKKIALTMEQVKKYNPPPNPAKMTDPRSKEFVEKYGASSWEVDAINPKELQNIISREIEAVIDLDKMNAWKAKEENDKARLIEAVDTIMQEE